MKHIGITSEVCDGLKIILQYCPDSRIILGEYSILCDGPVRPTNEYTQWEKLSVQDDAALQGLNWKYDGSCAWVYFTATNVLDSK